MLPIMLLPADIADLATEVAIAGTFGPPAAGSGGDALFEMIVGIVLLVYETSPG